MHIFDSIARDNDADTANIYQMIIPMSYYHVEEDINRNKRLNLNLA